MKKLLLPLISVIVLLWTPVKAHTSPSRSAHYPNNKAILVVPPDPTGVSVSSTAICAGESISLLANCSAGTVTWYNQQTGGSVLGTGTGLSQNPVVNTTYYASCVNGIEESGRVATSIVKVNIPKITATKDLLTYAAIAAFDGIDVGNSAFPKLIDLDGDGLLDMIIGEQEGKLVHYKQTAVNTMNFTLVTSNFNTIDVGDVASPTFTDLDGDNLLDLIIGRFTGTLAHYEQASLNSLTFNLVTNTFNSISLGNVAPKPTFTDLDGDGLLDLIVGKSDNNLSHYEQASANSLIFNLVTSSFINTSIGTSPNFTDFDNDGLLDLITAKNGKIIHYQQASANSLAFNLVSDDFSAISIFSTFYPTIADIDGDGLLEVICGKSDGTLQAFEQIPGSFTNYLTTVGIPTATQSILIWGGSCLSSNITVTVPTGFEVSLHENSGFANSVSLTQSGGSVSNTTVYIRFNPQTDGTFTGNLAISAINANTINYALAGCTPPSAPTGTSNATACAGSSATLSATCATGTIKWYSAQFGTLSGTGSPFVTPLLSSNTTYNVRCEGCNVSSFVSVQITVSSPISGAFDLLSKTICSNSSTSLSAMCSSGTVKWYASDETTLLYTGTTFVTPTLTTSTTYKVGCAVGSCLSEFSDVVVSVLTTPTGTSSPTICNNTTASLSANCTGATIKWYDANGTALQSTGSPFVTPNLTSTTAYKVRCELSGSPGCTSDFADITVTVTPEVSNPTATVNPTICGNTNTSLSASCSYGTIKWYNAGGTALQGTGSPFITPALNSDTIYKVRCESGGVTNCVSAFADVIVTVKPDVSPTGTANLTICENTTALLSASCGSSTVKWYDAAGTTLLSTGSSFETPNLSSTTTYKVRCESGGVPDCISNFVEITVTTSNTIIAPTGIANATICYNTTASLSASCTTGNVKWYDASGSTLQGTGSPFITSNLTSTTIYKVRCESGIECIGDFAEVIVTVNTFVGMPTGTATVTVCNNTTASLAASCATGTIKWYSVDGTTLLFSGSPFVTPILNANAYYKVRCEANTCHSNFIDISATIVANPTSISNTAVCNNTSATLSANCAAAAIKWYDASGTSLLFTGTPFITSNLTANTYYKVRCDNGSCVSNFETIAVNITTPKISAIKNPQVFSPITALDGIDVGVGSIPKLIDLDGDGLLDMIIGEQEGKLVHYKQTAVNTMNFTLVTSNFNTIDVGDVASPTFTDLDGDNLLDLIIGRFTGTLAHYEQASLNSLTFNLVTNTFNSISLGNVAPKPTFTDLDGDGLLDLIIGKSGGDFIHYEQASTNSLIFNLVTNSFLGTDLQSSISPAFTDFDNNGLLDFIIGRSSTTFVYYKQANPNSLTFNLVTNSFNNLNLGISQNSTFSDIDGDGFLDMVIGKGDGTLNAFEQVPGTFADFLGSVGTPSATQTVQVWGGSCLSSNIIITAPTGFQVSLNANSGFSSNISITPNSGSVANTIVYVRFNPSSEGSFTGNLQISASNVSTINFALNGCTPPASPATSDVSVCVASSATLTATCTSGIVRWYSSSTGHLEATGSPFITNPLSDSRIYSVRCEDCNVSSFVDVSVNVTPPINAPFDLTPRTICKNTSASLSAICSAGTVKWFDSDETTLLYTGAPFITPNLTTNTTYKVFCAIGSCLSVFNEVDVTIVSVPIPTGTANPTICANTSTSLSANCAEGTVKWYNSTGTGLQGTGSAFVTPDLSTNTTYKVRCENDGTPDCSSDFVDVIVTISPTLSTPTGASVSSAAICSGTNITLTASCAIGMIRWYNQQTAGTIIGTTSPLIQSPVSTTTYYVSCVNGLCETSRMATNQVVVTTQPPLPTAISVSSTAICSGSNVSLSATCAAGTVTWYNQATGGTVIGTGTNFSQSPTVNTIYYVSCKNGNCQTNRIATNLVTVAASSSTLNLTTNISSGATAQIAIQTITATNKIISPASVTYKAGNAILLNAGFEAQNGSIFRAYIGGCSN
ncbi:FG-GAP-like repeat-containing protein [Emticicia sp. BO119]|uniref:Ig-like domain-containing protein n=1 Tax=Emticicia sp. BO119 TaxID=2757768 RepID=UPI0015F065B4|nr:FG-GAP-like repeat-containing protein [Emticicia sp. BO119]MBA4853678.1 VCBS repeat-containing protein [Emticicia sp. BO119]